MRRAVISALAIGCAAASAVPVLADAPADAGRTAGAFVSTKLPGGDTLTLDFSAAELSGGPRLIINTTRCAGENRCISDQYVGALRAGELSIDPSAPTARLDTTLSGRALSITWKQADDSGYEVGGARAAGSFGDAYATEYAGDSAAVSVHFDGAGCQGVGGVGHGILVDSSVDGGSEAQPLSALELPAGTTFSC